MKMLNFILVSVMIFSIRVVQVFMLRWPIIFNSTMVQRTMVRNAVHNVVHNDIHTLRSYSSRLLLTKIYYFHRKINCHKIYHAHSMRTKLDLILRGSYYWSTIFSYKFYLPLYYKNRAINLFCFRSYRSLLPNCGTHEAKYHVFSASSHVIYGG